MVILVRTTNTVEGAAKRKGQNKKIKNITSIIEHPPTYRPVSIGGVSKFRAPFHQSCLPYESCTDRITCTMMNAAKFPDLSNNVSVDCRRFRGFRRLERAHHDQLRIGSCSVVFH